jgi:hypothetical protein
MKLREVVRRVRNPRPTKGAARPVGSEPDGGGNDAGDA